MKFSYKIVFFENGDTSYPIEAKDNISIKDINKHLAKYPKDRCTIQTEGYRISNTARKTWVVYKCGKWVDKVVSNEYNNLGNAVKHLEKIMEV